MSLLRTILRVAIGVLLVGAVAFSITVALSNRTDLAKARARIGTLERQQVDLSRQAAALNVTAERLVSAASSSGLQGQVDLIGEGVNTLDREVAMLQTATDAAQRTAVGAFSAADRAAQTAECAKTMVKLIGTNTSVAC